MKKALRKTCIALPLLMLASLIGVVNAAPYGPKGRSVEFTQPDGQKLSLKVFGDDYYARTETEEGYTVVYSKQDRAYYYAKPAAKGEDLKPSAVLANRPAPKDLEKHLDCSIDKVQAVIKANRTRYAGERDARWQQRVRAFNTMRRARVEGRPLSAPQSAAAAVNSNPVIGDRKGLTILVQFPNDPATSGKDPVDFPVSRAKMVNFCNKVGYNEDGNSGSVRDYFFDQSNGKLTYTQSVTQIVTLNRPREYYNYSDYPANNTLRDNGDAGNLLIADAVAILKAQSYNFAGLSTDATNNILATNLIFAGQDSGVWSEGLWPHQWNMQSPINVGTTGSPLYVNAYQITNLPSPSTRIGTFIHENGHLLMGYPDLYTYVTGTGEGVGLHCVMAAGSYCDDEKTPAPVDAYLKDVSGWANVIDLDVNDYVKRTLPSTGNVTYRVTNPAAATESFYVENRGNGDKWAKGVADKGILIWHIDETIDGNGTPFPHYGVSIEQADGRLDIENGANLGDTGDAFDSSDPLFARGSKPNSRWWDDSNSSFRMKALTSPMSKMEVQFGSLPPNMIVVGTPNGGEVLYRDSTYKIEWEANITGDVRIDLYKGANHVDVITSATPNSGSFKWDVPNSINPGSGYKIHVSSVSNPIPAFDDSDSAFELSATSFPVDGKMPYGWHKAKGADTSWAVTDSRAYEGKFSLGSIKPGDGKTSGISYTSNFEAGVVTFYMRVSTEGGYDFGRFFIDGEAQLLPGAQTKKGLSGFGSWVFASYSIPKGPHTLTWSYEKDTSMAGGKDGVWLDAVALPPTTQEIVVRDENGVGLVSDKSLASFPKTQIDKRSRPLTFTIRNRGKADLFGLSVVAKGDDASFFDVGPLGSKTLKPGESTTFSVVFAPKSVGSKQTELRIKSNDSDENPFIIHAVGNSSGVPEIVVSQPADTKLKDGKSKVNFGYSKVGQEGVTKTFTVKNVGTAKLTGLKIKKSGAAKDDFSISNVGARALAPGESATFKVTFTPSARDERAAELHITNDYKPNNTFDVKVVGNGVPKNIGKSEMVSAASADLLEAVFGGDATPAGGTRVGVVTINGLRYKTLTFTKPSVPDGLRRTVEVSPNLVDWYSGRKHTSIVTDTATYQTVRDNTPLRPDAKRYIRLKTSRR